MSSRRPTSSHLTIAEAINTIKRKTGVRLTYREMAALFSTGDLQLCFKWQPDKCTLGIIADDCGFDYISEISLIGARGQWFTLPIRALYLNPLASNCNEYGVLRAIKAKSKDPISIQVARAVGSKWRFLLMVRDSRSSSFYGIDSTHKNGWQLFDKPLHFLELERFHGAGATHTIMLNDLLVPRTSINAYSARFPKPKKTSTKD